jgi:Glyoxalase/Bleomycin resistance protein/Dioxygenase superfamily
VRELLGQPFFHVGVLVTDLDAAMEDFKRTLGVSFRPVSRLAWDRVKLDEQDGYPDLETFEELRLVYSIAGPPYLELIEMTGNGVWGTQHAEGLHHIGLDSSDVVSDITAAKDIGWYAESLMFRVGELRCSYMSPLSLHGTRVEFCPGANPPPSSMDEVRRPA